MNNVAVTIHDYGDTWQYTGDESAVRELEVRSDANGYEVRIEVTQREAVPWVSANTVDVDIRAEGSRLNEETLEMTPRITYTEVDGDGYSVYEAYLTNHPLA